MSGQQLTEEQKNKIDELKKAWMDEFDELDKTLPMPEERTLDGPRTWEFVKLNEKYQKLISAVYDGENN